MQGQEQREHHAYAADPGAVGVPVDSVAKMNAEFEAAMAEARVVNVLSTRFRKSKAELGKEEQMPHVRQLAGVLLTRNKHAECSRVVRDAIALQPELDGQFSFRLRTSIPIMDSVAVLVGDRIIQNAVALGP